MNYVLLDYDGFVCKAFYAARARNEDFACYEVLKQLEDSAIDRASKFFGMEEDFQLFKFMSGHTFKKEIYPDYKINRKRDESLSDFRQMVTDTDNSIIKQSRLEADDCIISFYDSCTLDDKYNTLVFSDDKDLKFYCGNICNINITKEVNTNYFEKEKYLQMLAGDKEDDISGIKGIGFHKAEKLLNNDYNIENVIRAYKRKCIPIDETIKQLVLVTPLCGEFKFNTNLLEMKKELINAGKYNQDVVDEAIVDFVQGIAEKVKKVYE